MPNGRPPLLLGLPSGGNGCMNAVNVKDTIAGLRQQCESDRAAAFAKCQERGIEPVSEACFPPSDDELRNDYWYYAGMVDALEDLGEELELEAERLATAVSS